MNPIQDPQFIFQALASTAPSSGTPSDGAAHPLFKNTPKYVKSMFIFKDLLFCILLFVSYSFFKKSNHWIYRKMSNATHYTLISLPSHSVDVTVAIDPCFKKKLRTN